METDQLLDQEVLDELLDIMGEDMPMLITSFIEDSRTKLGLLAAMAPDSQQQEIFKMAHSIKGSARNVGLFAFSEVCERIENLARAGDLTSSDFDIDRLNTLFSSSIEILVKRYH
jgi:HPt (histidine-containing phosphotransfer) domain-containing protein